MENKELSDKSKEALKAQIAEHNALIAEAKRVKEEAKKLQNEVSVTSQNNTTPALTPEESEAKDKEDRINYLLAKQGDLPEQQTQRAKTTQSDAISGALAVHTMGKSPLLAFVLTFFLSSIGLFYTNAILAIFWFIIEVTLAIVTLGFSIFITWPLSIIFGVLGASNKNKKIMSQFLSVD